MSVTRNMAESARFRNGVTSRTPAEKPEGIAMTSVIYTDADGTARTLEAAPGESVMTLATRNGIPGIVGDCGGVLSCATCHVFVDSDDLDMLEPMSDMEDEMLDGTAVDRADTSRLSCQIFPEKCSRDLHVTTPSMQE